MTARHAVKLTGHFERNLREIEAFLAEAQATQAFDALLDELAHTVVPNLERFPGMGRLFLERPVRSAEVAHGVGRLTQQLAALSREGELREYVMRHYLLMYARVSGTVYLLSIRHQRQLSFDLPNHWPA